MAERIQSLEVWGDFACFTNPVAKAERFSYPAPTPSAVRGIFDSIYAKPIEFCWQVTRIEILKPIKYIALRRNEVKEKVPVTAHGVYAWQAGKEEPVPIMADVGKDYWGDGARGRTQRQTMALRDVKYRLHAFIKPWPGFEDRLSGLEMQFRRRAEKGKCVWQPFFGCREFPAYFRLLEHGFPNLPAPIELDLEVGWMVYDVFDLSRPGKNNDSQAISVFHASIKNGVIEVPALDSPAVRKAVEEVAQ
jgi:CRISPR-associated protein Cas5d